MTHSLCAPSQPAPTARIALLGSLLLSPVHAAEILVDSAADTRVNDGQCTLREALENVRLQSRAWADCAGGGALSQRITLQAGLGPIELSGPLEVARPVEIIGPPNRQLIRPAAGMTERLIDVVPLASGAYTLRNLELRGARHATQTNFPTSAGRGGAMWIDGAFFDVEVLLGNLHFEDNQVVAGTPSVGPRGGAAVFIEVNDASSVRIEDSIFHRNQIGNVQSPISGLGGAILARNARLSIARSLFTNNRPSALPGSGEGGALHVSGGQLSVLGTTFDSHLGPADTASVVDISSAPALLLDSVFELNAGRAVLKQAGSGSFLAVSNTSFERNTGTPLLLSGVTTSVSSSSFVGNQVIDGVAAIDAAAATLEIASSTLADNLSTHGSDGVGAVTGAIRLNNGSLILQDVSLIGNDTQGGAGQAASGIELTSASLTARNSVLHNTVVGEANLWRRGSSTVNMSHSLLSPPDSASEINGTNTGNLFRSADFAAAGNYGCAQPIGYLADRCAPTRPALNTSSATVDAGSSTRPNDQRGAGFDRDDGNGIDMGAIELQAPLVELLTGTVALAEGQSGTTPFVFTVRRRGDLRGTTQVGWQVQGQGAHPVDAADFGLASLPFGTAFFAEGVAETSISVSVLGDASAEFDEGFRLQLTQITGGRPGAATSASGIVLNDDSTFGSVATLALTPRVSDQLEGSTFYSTHRFRVTRTQDTSGFCSFTLTVQGTGLDPLEQSDLFSGVLGQPLPYQMGPGETTADLEVRIHADSEFEGDEQFSVSLGDPSGCVINQNARETFSTVFNDDSLFSITALDADKPEGDAGSTPFRFRIDRSGATQQAASVGWSVAGSGAQGADATDFPGGVLPSGQISLPPGVLSVELTVQVAGDSTVEMDEAFRVQLGNPRSGGSIDPLADAAQGLIRNDDSGMPGGGRLFADGFE